MCKKLINSAGHWLRVEKHPHYPKELSSCPFPQVPARGFYRAFGGRQAHFVLGEHLPELSVRKWYQPSPVSLSKSPRLWSLCLQMWLVNCAGVRREILCPMWSYQKCAACGAVSHSLTEQTKSVWSLLGLSGTDSSFLLKKTPLSDNT